MSSPVINYVMQPPVLLAVTAFIATCYCYKRALHSSCVSAWRNQHLFFSQSSDDQQRSGRLYIKLHKDLDSYVRNISASLCNTGLHPFQVDRAAKEAHKHLITSQLNCGVKSTSSQVTKYYEESLNVFLCCINSMVIKSTGSGLRTTDVLTRNEGQPSGKYATSARI